MDAWLETSIPLLGIAVGLLGLIVIGYGKEIKKLKQRLKEAGI